MSTCAVWAGRGDEEVGSTPMVRSNNKQQTLLLSVRAYRDKDENVRYVQGYLAAATQDKATRRTRDRSTQTDLVNASSRNRAFAR